MDENVIALIIAIVGTIWSFIQVTSWYKQNKDQKYLKALECLGVGVVEALNSYVYSTKNANPNKKLNEEEAKKARELAKTAALEVGKKTGIDIVSILGGDAFIDLHIEKQLKLVK